MMVIGIVNIEFFDESTIGKQMVLYIGSIDIFILLTMLTFNGAFLIGEIVNYIKEKKSKN